MNSMPHIGRAVRQRAAYRCQPATPNSAWETGSPNWSPQQSAAIGAWLDRPFARAILLGIAEFSPYLFDLSAPTPRGWSGCWRATRNRISPR